MSDTNKKSTTKKYKLSEAGEAVVAAAKAGNAIGIIETTNKDGVTFKVDLKTVKQGSRDLARLSHTSYVVEIEKD